VRADLVKTWRMADKVEPAWRERGMSAGNVIDVIARLTGQTWRVRRMPYPRKLLAEAAWPTTPTTPLPVIAIIRWDGDKKGHMVTWDGERVYDPALARPVKLGRYVETVIDGAVRLIAVIARVSDGDGLPKPPSAA
jgi:hypothetical protein